MRWKDIGSVDCSVARTLSVIGDRWTMLILREAFTRTRRFEDFQRTLGVARNVLSDRLGRLVDEGVLERRPYQDNPVRYEYRLTEKGLDLYPVLVSLMQWGNRYGGFDTGPPVELEHKRCGHATTPKLVCSQCGEELHAREVVAHEMAPAG